MTKSPSEHSPATEPRLPPRPSIQAPSKRAPSEHFRTGQAITPAPAERPLPPRPKRARTKQPVPATPPQPDWPQALNPHRMSHRSVSWHQHNNLFPSESPSLFLFHSFPLSRAFRTPCRKDRERRAVLQGAKRASGVLAPTSGHAHDAPRRRTSRTAVLYNYIIMYVHVI